MGKFIDMTGWRMSEHGVPNSRLTVIGLDKDRKLPCGVTVKYWKCKCDCGTITSVASNNLKAGKVISCGCTKKDRGLTQRTYNTFIDKGDYLEGYDTKGNCFLIDKEDYDKIKNDYWYLNNHGYWAKSLRNDSPKRKLMHQLICPSNSKDLIPDHYNRNRSDNRKSNLFLRTYRENSINIKLSETNKTGFIGVDYNEKSKRSKKWGAFAKIDKDKTFKKLFYTKEEAIFCRLCLEFIFYKELSPQRDLFEKYGITKEIAENYYKSLLEKKLPSNNTSGILGVYFIKKKSKWLSEICFKRKKYYLGEYKNKEEAIKARLKAELEFYGKNNAPQKHLFKQYGIE